MLDKLKNLLKELSGDNLLWLASFALVVVVSFSTSLIKDKVTYVYATHKSNAALLPVLSSTDMFPVLSAQGVIAIDLDSDVVLYEKNADSQLLPASTTKIVTAMVAMDYYDFDDEIVVPNIKVIGQKMKLVPGEIIRFEDLLYGLLVFSANDAAEVLAENYNGGRAAFIAAMNRKASILNLEKTFFVNPSGLEDNGHLSTARDLVRVSQAAMKNPDFARIVATKAKVVTSVDGKIAHRLENINKLIGKVDGVLGVKTGWTENSRENLVTYVDRGGKRIMIALLGSQDRFGETEELIEWIYNNFEWETVAFGKKR